MNSEAIRAILDSSMYSACFPSIGFDSAVPSAAAGNEPFTAPSVADAAAIGESLESFIVWYFADEQKQRRESVLAYALLFLWFVWSR